MEGGERMKESAGEANITVITIVLIGIIAAIAVPLITNMMSNTSRRSCCTNAGGRWNGNSCEAGSNPGYRAQDYNNCIRGTDGR